MQVWRGGGSSVKRCHHRSLNMHREHCSRTLSASRAENGLFARCIIVTHRESLLRLYCCFHFPFTSQCALLFWELGSLQGDFWTQNTALPERRLQISAGWQHVCTVEGVSTRPNRSVIRSVKQAPPDTNDDLINWLPVFTSF